MCDQAHAPRRLDEEGHDLIASPISARLDVKKDTYRLANYDAVVLELL
jgi:hypothetical protein